MYSLDEAVEIFDEVLNSERRKHLVGGTLISIGLLCFGLAITAMTLKED